jgi:hypothetical protein
MLGPVGKKLPTLPPNNEGIGVATIMDPELAARHGAEYVQLAAFAIDVDRVRELMDQLESEGAIALPFAWEVFLTEMYLLDRFDPEDDASRALLEDVCAGLVKGRKRSDGEPPLGSQLPFAVHDAVTRGAWPAELGQWFRSWGNRASSMSERLRPLWNDDPDQAAAELAQACLDMDLDPPLAEPTLVWLLMFAEATWQDESE